MNCSFRSIVILPALLLLPACLNVDPVDPPNATQWQGEIFPFDHVTDSDHEFSGSVAMLAFMGRTEFQVLLWDATPGVWYGWSVRTGGCLDSGQQVGFPGDFPAFVIEPSGSGQGFTTLSGNAPADMRYSLELFEEMDASGDPLACGELETIG